MSIIVIKIQIFAQQVNIEYIIVVLVVEILRMSSNILRLGQFCASTKSGKHTVWHNTPD